MQSLCNVASSPQASVCATAGAPFHDFKQTSAQPMPPGEAVQVRFQLMPTAYTFAKVCWQPMPPVSTFTTIHCPLASDSHCTNVCVS